MIVGTKGHHVIASVAWQSPRACRYFTEDGEIAAASLGWPRNDIEKMWRTRNDIEKDSQRHGASPKEPLLLLDCVQAIFAVIICVANLVSKL